MASSPLEWRPVSSSSLSADTAMGTLRTRVAMSAIARSFFVQAVWNYERMLNVGFAFCLIPAARRLCRRDPDGVKRFLIRHLAFFNANPFIATVAVGAVTRLEEDKRPDEEIARFKRTVCGPLGAVGDRTFWGILRPVSALVGVAVAVAGGGLWGAIAFLLVFNSAQLIMRTISYRQGYETGLLVGRALSGGLYYGIDRWGRRLGSLATGFLVAGLFSLSGRPPCIQDAGVFAASAIVGLLATRRSIPMNLLFPICIIGCAAVVKILLG